MTGTLWPGIGQALETLLWPTLAALMRPREVSTPEHLPSSMTKPVTGVALMQLWEQGKINPRVTESFALADGGKAIAKLGDRSAVGKLVVTI